MMKNEKESSFERFQRFIRGLALTPKKEIEAEEVKWREARLTKKRPAKA